MRVIISTVFKVWKFNGFWLFEIITTFQDLNSMVCVLTNFQNLKNSLKNENFINYLSNSWSFQS